MASLQGHPGAEGRHLQDADKIQEFAATRCMLVQIHSPSSRYLEWELVRFCRHPPGLGTCRRRLGTAQPCLGTGQLHLGTAPAC